ncbi:MAG TPA: lysophospholipid acyltransferase family protein [Sphingobium sp.]
MAARAVGCRVAITGVPLRQSVLLVSNHVSWIDILALGGAARTTFISKDDVERWPVIGWLAAQNDTIFIARSRRGDAGAQVHVLRDALARQRPVTLFAEGTTGDGKSLLPFKPSLFAAIIPAPGRMRVQPVYLDYGDAAPDIAWVGTEEAGANALRVMGRKGPLPLTIHFLDSFDPADFPDRKAIAAEARKRIEARLQPSLPPSPAV